ncbi:hypothetical protein ACGFU4_05720 [Streptomyces sp. NPDC048511]|uniref:hypothetical protein n=1 Tax=Streptomyces sp. NPDC048511 TaxID=3365562 RepID=UPI003723D199
MSRSAGPHTADPCPRCCVEAVRTGVPKTDEGRDRVQVRGTGGEWLRWAERWQVILY